MGRLAAAKAKQVRRGVKEVVKALRKKETGYAFFFFFFIAFFFPRLCCMHDPGLAWGGWGERAGWWCWLETFRRWM
jgi:hypothetical protein